MSNVDEISAEYQAEQLIEHFKKFFPSLDTHGAKKAALKVSEEVIKIIGNCKTSCEDDNKYISIQDTLNRWKHIDNHILKQF